MAFLRLQSVEAQDQGFHVPIRRRHHLGILLPGRAHGLIAAYSLLDGIGRQRNLLGVGQCAADLRHGPMAGEAGTVPSTEQVPTELSPLQGQRGFLSRASGLWMCRTLAVPAAWLVVPP